jgi:maleate isomerase
VQEMCQDISGASAHFSRIPVVGDTGGASDYAWARMLDAADLLSHVKPDVISWNGTKGGAMGFDIDRELTRQIAQQTGIPASTSALAILDALTLLQARRIALVTPYDAGYQAKCIAAFKAQGFLVTADKGAGLLDNFAYGEVPQADIASMTRAAVAEGKPDAVVYFCTNFHGAAIAPELEAELDLPILDSTALGVWGALRATMHPVAALGRWGRIFRGGSSA